MAASGAGYTGVRGLPIYCAAKHGLVGLMRSLRTSLINSKISISIVAPAMTDTPLLSTTHADPGQLLRSLEARGLPANRPEAVSQAVAWLVTKGLAANGLTLHIQAKEAIEIEQSIDDLMDVWMGKRHSDMTRNRLVEGIFAKDKIFSRHDRSV